jgi:uncharacterized protein (DUF58 family)
MLTSPEFLQRIEHLHLLAKKVLSGSLQADRRTVAKGSGITFADYAEYRPGDDYRAIDWRVFARFEQLVIKLFEMEEDTTIYLLLDTSPSMAAKLPLAKELTALLGAIALLTHDRVCVYAMSDRLTPLLEPSRGRSHLFPMLQALEQAGTTGEDTDFTTCMKQFQARHKRKGLVVTLSDFFFPDGFESGLDYLLYHKHSVFCLQVLSPQDTHWDWVGDCALTCVETQQANQLTLTREDVQRFMAAVQQWNEDLAAACVRRGVGLATTTTALESHVIVEDILRRGGLVAGTSA